MAQRDLATTQSTLTAWLRSRLPGATDVSITDLVLPIDGASNETILFDASWTEGGAARSERLVLRVQPDDHQLFYGMDVFLQSRMMKAVAAHSDVPVPTVLFEEPTSDALGSPFYVMRRVDGLVPNGFASPLMQQLDAVGRRRLYLNGLDAMARVHQLDWRDGFEFLAGSGPGEVGLDRYLAFVEDWYAWARDGRTFDTVERGLKHLRAHQPKNPPVSVAWGDSRPGNMMFDPDTQAVSAVLDWELAALATPETDLAWWLMFERVFTEGQGASLPEGALDRDEILAEYERLLGRPLDHFGYYDVLTWTRFRTTFIRHVDLDMDRPHYDMIVKLADWVDDRLAESIGD